MTTARYEQKQLLEQLLGKEQFSRNHKRRREITFQDYDVCKSFLLGVCPYEMFSHTKQDLGRCSKIHLDKYKLAYEKAVENGEKFPEIEKDVIHNLENFIFDCNEKIKQSLKRLEYPKEERFKLIEQQTKIEEIDIKINIKGKEVKKLTELGEVSKAVEVNNEIVELKVLKKFEIKKFHDVSERLIGQSAQQKLQICEKCGAFLSRLDSDRRLSDHFLGKVHLNYVKIRDVLGGLKRKYR